MVETFPQKTLHRFQKNAILPTDKQNQPLIRSSLIGDMRYYYVYISEDEMEGPFPENEIKREIRKRKLEKGSYLCPVGADVWIPTECLFPGLIKEQEGNTSKEETSKEEPSIEEIVLGIVGLPDFSKNTHKGPTDTRDVAKIWAGMIGFIVSFISSLMIASSVLELSLMLGIIFVLVSTVGITWLAYRIGLLGTLGMVAGAIGGIVFVEEVLHKVGAYNLKFMFAVVGVFLCGAIGRAIGRFYMPDNYYDEAFIQSVMNEEAINVEAYLKSGVTKNAIRKAMEMTNSPAMYYLILRFYKE